MSYGVIINLLQKPIIQAPFYIPILAPHVECKSSHVYLDLFELDKKIILSSIAEVPINVVVIIAYDEEYDFSDFLSTVTELKRPIAIALPINDDLEYWYLIRDAKGRLQDLGIDIILDLNLKVSETSLARFKCLPYSSVLLLTEQCDLAKRLLKKPMVPTLLIHHIVAMKKPVEFWRNLAKPELEPALDLLIDPLQPLVVDMKLDVYDTFQTDDIKYNQYDCAIELAILDLRLKKHKLNILVVGAGKGPLLLSTIRHALIIDHISVIEKNPLCKSILKRIAKQRPNTKVECVDIRDISSTNQYDLVISELLGSFGCNEACPEILQNFKDSSAIFIPTSYCSLIQPIYASLQMADLHRPYLVNLSASLTNVDPEVAFQFVHPGENRLCQSRKLEFCDSDRECANALCGYFEAVLYGPYKIGNSPRLSCLEKCKSWFPIIFPIKEEKYPLKVKVSRRSDHDLRYLWEVNGVAYGHEEVDSDNYRVLL